jgi:antitoxin component YwqK of YwqJK toxin-antitoxin module
MNEELLSRKELIETGHDYGELEMEEPPSDRLLVPTEDSEEGSPVTGLVYDLDEKDGTLLYYGEYEEGLPHGISADFHRNGRPKRICRIFRGAINGEDHRWDSEGRLVFHGQYVYGVLIRYKQWNASGNLISEQAEPDPSMLGLIESQRSYYENRE